MQNYNKERERERERERGRKMIRKILMDANGLVRVGIPIVEL